MVHGGCRHNEANKHFGRLKLVGTCQSLERTRRLGHQRLVANEVERTRIDMVFPTAMPASPDQQHPDIALMHALLRAIGVFALIAGLGFMGSGFRYFSYPGDGFMMVYYGSAMAVVGLLLIIFSRPSDEPRV
jgi:hypothetical protein